ncbi:MAG TPA: threonine dehydratase [Candidatus Binataceae bacterium]|nr:threonine dehydratase [Candidatus Binataceae bacterium]
MRLPRLEQIEEAAQLIYSVMRPTPEIAWPLLASRCGTEVWVKHENHSPIGAFKLRGGLIYIDSLARGRKRPAGVIAATRGNHGQSIAAASRRHGLRATIVVPHGNSVEKNAAMRAFGADLIEQGHDFQAALEFANAQAAERGLSMIPSFDELLVRGVATYSLEFLRAVQNLDTVYVPIGLGSGICGMFAAREALGLTTKVVGVVSANAPAYALSFAAGRPVATDSSATLADGMACRVPEPSAVELINRHAERVVTVSDDEITSAMRHYFTDTHNIAEGAGAAPLAALLKERAQMTGRSVGLVLSGGNVDREQYVRVLEQPQPSIVRPR